MKYLSILDYFNGVPLASIDPVLVANANTLIPRVNLLLEAFKEFRAQTSGLRSMEHHLEIYRLKNEARAKLNLPALHIPLSSKHLSAQAIDVEDANGKLKEFITKNIKLLEDIGLWCEHPDDCPTWVHFQCVGPTSGSRIFHP